MNQKGLTLLELVVAVAILAVGSIAAIRAMDQARLSLGGAMPRLMAQIAAHNRAEELRLFGVGGNLPATRQMGPYQITLTVTRTTTAGGLVEARILARAETGEGALLVTYVDPNPGAGG